MRPSATLSANGTCDTLGAMTKEERLRKQLQEAKLLSAQGRWAEAKLKYETLIKALWPKSRSTKKKAKST